MIGGVKLTYGWNMLNIHHDVFIYYIFKVPGSFSLIPVLLAETSYVCVLCCVNERSLNVHCECTENPASGMHDGKCFSMSKGMFFSCYV
jgi:hypothetical protein